MSISVIVYTSETGFTKEYAQMLGKAAKLKVVSMDEAEGIDKSTEIFYMGPLMIGRITGLDQALKQCTVKAACGVGMSPPGKKVLADISRSNYVAEGPIFYLRGGYAPKKVSWIKRRMVYMMTKSMRENLQKKTKRTPEEQVELDVLLKGGSFVAYQNLNTILGWLKEQA